MTTIKRQQRKKFAPEGTKWCSMCKQYLRLAEFRPCDGANDGLTERCRGCERVYQRQRYAARKLKRAI